ncbi:T9SS type A sorting domain-containing protein [Flavobacterium sp. MAH-1]|uniref:T9SS type A sorting domain-containing protein n=1 Tax=Flavobacterium agri TaxID=2743471 RepID=A0A7Y9C6U0_9FLAO|nr:T9SS type A sorting domain-containing protein [Flavobacterium agri]NUY81755.1 T9SS type A sorting domain-containing protein [Flavobacterium agri]NYA71779.1 T9SS type A sorting domain-containing protein [Flavobacterium agri]
MQKIFTFLLSIGCLALASAQLEPVTSFTTGGGDYVNPPISPQSQYSHSQTIYHKDRLDFIGTINTISYFTIFSGSSLQNSGQWIVRIGYTDKDEFTDGEPFIPDSETTEVFNVGTMTYSGTELKLTLAQPFYYNREHNLVIDVREIQPGSTSSALTGFLGSEFLFEPPKVTAMNFSGGNAGPGIWENSLARIKFGGDLQKCPTIYAGNVNNVETTTATAYWPNPNNVVAFEYSAAPEGQPIPTTYVTTMATTVQLTELLPGTHYKFYRRSQCDFGGDFSSYPFATKPLPLTVPTHITFEGQSDYNYRMDHEWLGFIKLSNMAGNNSQTGVRLAGYAFTDPNPWQEFGSDDWWQYNDDYLSSLLFQVDLTAFIGNPVFKFDLRQNSGSLVRVLVNGVAQPFVFAPEAESGNPFHTVAIDLSDYVGLLFDVEIQHIGHTASTSDGFETPDDAAFIDNIKLEQSCDVPSGFTILATQSSLSLEWDSEAAEFEVAIVPHDGNAPFSGMVISTKNHQFDNLPQSTAYDIFVRSNCDGNRSGWIKVHATTLPEPITAPYYQNQNVISSAKAAPQFNKSSDIFYNTVPSSLSLFTKQTGLPWIGGDAPTEEQAWNANRAYVSAMKYRIDATQLATVAFKADIKQQYYYQSPLTNWFRVLVNGQQFGPSRHANVSTNDPFSILTLDLTPYAGQIIDVTLESCSKYTTYVNGGHMNLTRLRSIQVQGTPLLDVADEQKKTFSVFPNPTQGLVSILASKELSHVEVLDISGKKIRDFEVSGMMADLDISGLQSGTYLVKVTANGTSETVKVIKQ